MMKLTILLVVIAIAQQAYCGWGYHYQSGPIIHHQSVHPIVHHQYKHPIVHHQYVTAGGNTAAQGPYPNQVSFISGGQQSCGGCMISQEHILTSAHCVQNPTDLQVIVRHANAPNGVRHNIKKIQPHPDYTGQQGGYEHNIAVVTVEPTSCNHEQMPILPIATQNFANCNKCTGTISAYEKTSSMPQWYQVNIMTQESCPEHCNCQCPRTNNQIYTVVQPGQSECTGIAGSPLIIDNQVAGVCSRKASSGEMVYSNAYQYSGFINECLSS